jgi:hypothetical protein
MLPWFMVNREEVNRAKPSRYLWGRELVSSSLQSSNFCVFFKMHYCVWMVFVMLPWFMVNREEVNRAKPSRYLVCGRDCVMLCDAV